MINPVVYSQTEKDCKGPCGLQQTTSVFDRVSIYGGGCGTNICDGGEVDTWSPGLPYNNGANVLDVNPGSINVPQGVPQRK